MSIQRILIVNIFFNAAHFHVIFDCLLESFILFLSLSIIFLNFFKSVPMVKDFFFAESSTE